MWDQQCHPRALPDIHAAIVILEISPSNNVPDTSPSHSSTFPPETLTLVSQHQCKQAYQTLEVEIKV